MFFLLYVMIRWWQGIQTPSLRSSNVTEDSSLSSIDAPLAGMDVSAQTAQSLATTLDELNDEGIVSLVNFAYIKLNASQVLGRGSFSIVFVGKYRKIDCAVKLIYTPDLTVDTIKRVAAEAELLSSIKSPHVVDIYGVGVLPPSVCILLEICKYVLNSCILERE